MWYDYNNDLLGLEAVDTTQLVVPGQVQASNLAIPNLPPPELTPAQKKKLAKKAKTTEQTIQTGNPMQPGTGANASAPAPASPLWYKNKWVWIAGAAVAAIAILAVGKSLGGTSAPAAKSDDLIGE